ncbi:16S rRNA (guanine(527)-N(7))-methyltransferase RsmG [Kiloniella sp. b19]|uniref:16S rRNA (guanine(527)-N(7))-methyltransferase RsmG n=1 Tax=Kiloniella sp. GXU_MW_B19 TaxID=3141326 RepID=UPI0031D10001
MLHDRDLFLNHFSVSRETLDKLNHYHDLLLKWNRAINLVSRSTQDQIWERHFLDSAQVLFHMNHFSAKNYRLDLTDSVEEKKTVVDFGSGAGFPSLIMAILGVGTVHAIESDTRKATFLREVSRETECNLIVHNKRIEKVEPFAVDYVTARAFAPLNVILELGKAFSNVSRETEFLLLKGRTAEEELTLAQKTWNIVAEKNASVTDPEASVLSIRLQG